MERSHRPSKLVKIVKEIFFRIGVFILILLSSPFWVFAGIIVAISALFGSFSKTEYEVQECELNCPYEVEGE